MDCSTVLSAAVAGSSWAWLHSGLPPACSVWSLSPARALVLVSNWCLLFSAPFPVPLLFWLSSLLRILSPCCPGSSLAELWEAVCLCFSNENLPSRFKNTYSTHDSLQSVYHAEAPCASSATDYILTHPASSTPSVIVHFSTL